MEMVKVAKGDRDMLSWNLNKSLAMLMSKGDNMLLGILILGPPKDAELNDICKSIIFLKVTRCKNANC